MFSFNAVFVVSLSKLLNKQLSMISDVVMLCKVFNDMRWKELFMWYFFFMLPQSFQPMGVQLSLKAALPLTKMLVTALYHSSKKEPWMEQYLTDIAQVWDCLAPCDKM